MTCEISYEKGGKINVKAVADQFFWLPFQANFALAAPVRILVKTRFDCR
jgi:hypothetical protein